MITVDRIKIEEFRGIRDLTVDLGSVNFAVCGPNGTGKSGIVDALEFGPTGPISRVVGKGRGALARKPLSARHHAAGSPTVFGLPWRRTAQIRNSRHRLAALSRTCGSLPISRNFSRGTRLRSISRLGVMPAPTKTVGA